MTKNLAELTQLTKVLRARIIETSHRSGTPHLGSCLSCADILAALYFEVLRIDPQRPDDPGRDRFLLSKGHAAPALFQVLAMRGYFADSLLDDYGADGSAFGEHPPARGMVPGIEAATGSLGHGLPVGLGMALSARLTKSGGDVFVLLGDGECNEGSVWEGAMMASAARLERLTVIVDYNKWQATGRSNDILSLSPLAEKWRAFGWSAVEVDGHDLGALIDVLSTTAGDGRPLAVIAHTVKGKGVSFMEDDNNWHYRIPSEAELRAARAELGFLP